jgi:Fe2+ or Zn2+ uptake regulation protein
MVASSERRSVSSESEEVRVLLSRSGLRFSRPRAAILTFFRERARHVSAEGLFRALRDRGEPVSLSTVYLNLATLCDAGLVREIVRPGEGSLYDSSVVPHHHIVCRDSGDVLDLPELMVGDVTLGRFLQEEIERATGWQVDVPQLSFSGRSPPVFPDHEGIDETS